MRFWLTASAAVAVFLAAGVFFATRGSLGEADQWASVGSFLLALATAGIAVTIAARRRPDETGGSRNHVNKIKDAGVVSIGDHTTINVNRDGGSGARRGARRGR